MLATLTRAGVRAVRSEIALRDKLCLLCDLEPAGKEDGLATLTKAGVKDGEEWNIMERLAAFDVSAVLPTTSTFAGVKDLEACDNMGRGAMFEQCRLLRW